MARMMKCDICKKPTTQIVAKLFYSENKKPDRSASIHSNYKKHLDVGVCCNDRVLTAFDWQDRMTAAEYHQSRAKSKGGRRGPAVENKQAEGV